MKDLNIQQLNDLQYCIGIRYREIFKGYHELNEDAIPIHLLEEANRLLELSDIIYLELKTI